MGDPLREALERIADGIQCEKVVQTASPSGWCRNRPDQSIDAPYTADRWCNACIARAALASTEAPEEDRLTPVERERVEWRRAEYQGARISSDVIGLLLIIDRIAPRPLDTPHEEGAEDG